MEDTEKMEQRTDSEKNKSGDYRFIILFYFLGTVYFIPQSFYVSSNKYWMYKFRNVSSTFNPSDTDDKTSLQKQFTSYTHVAMSTGTIVFLVLAILLRNKISLQRRIIGSMIFLLAFLVLTMIFTFVDTDSWQEGFFTVALLIGGLQSCSSSVLMLSLFQLVPRFPYRCLAAQLAGQSICGILAAAIQIFALLVAPSEAATAALHYATAALTVVGTMVAYIMFLKRSEDFQAHLVEKPMTPEEMAKPPLKIELALIKKVAKKFALILISLFLCVSYTSILHAGLTSLIESSGKGTNDWSDTYFVPVCVFLSYSSFDFIGREASNYFLWLKNLHLIYGTAVVRMVLLPFILMCNLQPKNNIPLVFHEDAFFIIFVILLALSNGYIANISVIVLPDYCGEREERIIGAIFIVLIIVVVSLIFSVLSGVIVNVM